MHRVGLARVFGVSQRPTHYLGPPMPVYLFFEPTLSGRRCDRTVLRNRLAGVHRTVLAMSPLRRREFLLAGTRRGHRSGTVWSSPRQDLAIRASSEVVQQLPRIVQTWSNNCSGTRNSAHSLSIFAMFWPDLGHGRLDSASGQLRQICSTSAKFEQITDNIVQTLANIEQCWSKPAKL